MPSPQPNMQYEEAAAWFVALQSELPPAEIQRWERWIDDPDNRARFDALSSLWDRSKAIKPLPLPAAHELATDDYDGSASFSEWSAARSGTAAVTPETSGARFAGQRMAWILGLRPNRQAFAFVTAVVAILAVAWIFFPRTADDPQLYETGIAEHRTVHLPDGSEAWLGAQTSLWVTYTAHRRTVLLDRGEVSLHVAPQRSRPFAVLAGNGVITAVGTRFEVKRNLSTERVTVTVTEGVVRVEPRSAHGADGNNPPPMVSQSRPVVATLNKGRRVSYDERGGLSAVRPVDIESAATWRDGLLRYRDESLREVVADVNRYSRREIIFLDDSADTLRYTGTVFQGEVDDWIDGLPGIFDLDVVEADAQHVRFRGRRAPL